MDYSQKISCYSLLSLSCCLLYSPPENKDIRLLFLAPRFPSAGNLALRRLGPSCPPPLFTFSSAMRMVNRIHCRTSYLGSPAKPSGPPRFAKYDGTMFHVGELANRGVVFFQYHSC